MRQLEKEFKGKGEVKGYNFKQLKRSEKAYLYEVSSDDSQNLSYEIFKHVENERFGTVSYPRSKSFGKWAFVTQSLERANEIFENLSS